MQSHALQNHVLYARDLIIQRGDLLLSQPLSLELSKGQILHVEGQNGAGKSTLLQMLAGLLPVQQPNMLRWGELPPSEWPLLYIGHKAGLSGALSVHDNLAFLQRINHSDQGDLNAALEVVGLAGYEETPVRQLSSGQKRRANLARLWLSAQSPNPAPLWLLDEPLTALDQRMVNLVCTRISEFAAVGGRVILTSHQPLTIATDRLNLDDYLQVEEGYPFDEDVGE